MEYKDGKGRLIVENLAQDEKAKFSCVATNIAGEAKTMSAVSVTGELR